MSARLTGVRVAYADAPAPVRAFVDATLGDPVVSVTARAGGMSPAVAATVAAADGRRAFVKAVGRTIHPDTPDHFRHEAAVLSALPTAPYRAELLATYDDGDWVAIVMADIDGGHPDWADPTDRGRVLDAVLAQTAELTPPPSSLPDVSTRDVTEKHLRSVETASEPDLALLPAWARADLPALTSLIEATLAHHRDEAYCHWDVRYDNIVLRPQDRQPVLVDWGMSRRGQRWGDVMCLGLEWVETPRFDQLLERLEIDAREQADVTGFLAGLGLFCLISAKHPAHPSLPALPSFRRDVGNRCLTGVRRRLDALHT